MICSDNSFSLDIPCKCEGRCIKKDFYFLKDFFFPVGTEWSLLIEFIQVNTMIEGWSWSGPDPNYDWSMRPIWAWDLLTWILPDWKESLMESWHLHSLPFNFNKNFTLLFWLT